VCGPPSRSRLLTHARDREGCDFEYDPFSCQQISHRSTNCFLHQLGVILALIWLPRPEEAFQPIFAAARDNVCVQMRHALADAIVHRYECSVRVHGRLDRASEKLRVSEEGPDQVLGQIGKSLVVCFRN
jgi:hypothetical protein